MPRSKIWLYAAILIATTLSIYAHTARYGFIGWDDDKDVLNKPRIQQLTAASVVHLFNPFGIFRGQYYYEYFPITDLTYMIEWHFYGKDFPQGFHFDNVLLQVINVLLIFIAIKMLLLRNRFFDDTGQASTRGTMTTQSRSIGVPPILRKMESREKKGRPPESDQPLPEDQHQVRTVISDLSTPPYIMAAFITAMLFAVHPLMVENVSWLSGRKDLLLMMFSLLWFAFYMKAGIRHDSLKQQTDRRKLDFRFHGNDTEGVPRQSLQDESHTALWSILSFICFVLALLSKFQGVTIPGILIAYELFINKNSVRNTAKKLIPYLIVLLFYVPYTLWYYHKGATAFVDDKGLLWTIMFIPEALFIYMRKLVFPFDLTPVYTVPSFSDTGLLIVSLLFFIGLAAGIVRLFHNKAWVFLFGLSWFIANFIPVSNIISLPTKMADRYMYEAALGVFLIAGAAMTDFYNRTAMKRVSAVLYAAIFILLALVSYRQSLYWENSYSLWTYTIPLQPQSPVARNNLGVYYKDHGQLQLAGQEYEKALHYDKDFVPALWNLGMMYVNDGNYDKAFPLLKRMSEIKAPEQYMACRAVGALYLKVYDNPARAKKYFEMSYRLNPHQPDVKTLKMLIDTL
ncbi:MAG: hypothetical protein M1591_11340 [Deltaproteobacteria bacterium]|nr:hypothetical protein [Deltaproteobacteria bacterium]